MTGAEYVLWFILMAVGIALILGLGTLKMAGVLHRREHHGHHHWYDRFIHHHPA